MNENKFEIFSSAEFGSVRTLETTDGKVLFCGADVAKALGYKDTRHAITAHCKGGAKYPVLTNGGYQETTFITEGDMYRLITHSKLPNAEHFEAWVFDEVLPTIRKYGGYGNVNVEEIIVKAVTAAVAETVKAIIPLMTAQPQPAPPEQSKRIRKKYKYITPSKISTLAPELKQKVDEMIISGEYSCQQIANYIENNSSIKISQMSVNRYKRSNFYEAEKLPVPAMEQVKEKWFHISEAFCFNSETELTAVDKFDTYIMNIKR